MHIRINELKSSWSHCKDLITSNATLDLVVAFLEEFKVQFTQFYKQVKNSLTKKHQQIAMKLVDSIKLFWKEEGEISQLISFVKTNWHAKKLISKYVKLFDTIIASLITTYSSNKTTI